MMRALVTILAAALAAVALPSYAEEAKSPVASSYESEQERIAQEQPFKVIILGTRRGSDIDVIRKNVEKLSYVSIFIPTTVTQRHIEFEGRFADDEETLIADVESLAQDRYEMKARSDRRYGLVITLRKIKERQVETPQAK